MEYELFRVLWGCTAIGFGAGWIVGGIVHAGMIHKEWRQDAVEHGKALYDTSTGKWRWKEKDEV